MARKIAAGNWKMNGTGADLATAKAIADVAAGCDVVLCPSFTLLSRMAEAVKCSAVQIGGQDCHANGNGAHTGDISADMLFDAGASQVILGHSERRTDHGETDANVADKTRAAWGAGLIVILCLGETENQRDAGETLDVIARQLSGSLPDGATSENVVIAYEPVWAIGTGRTASTAEIGEVHNALRGALCDRLGSDIGNGIPLLYGGSVKAANAKEIFAVPNVDGALVGGASLKAQDFMPIVAALSES